MQLLSSALIGWIALGASVASIASQPLELDDTRITTLSPDSVKLVSARLSPAKRGFYVKGSVRKKFGHFAGLGGHVHIRLIDSNDKLIEEKFDRISPPQIPRKGRGRSGRSRYIVRFDNRPPNGARVEVEAHGRYRPNCER